MKMPYALLLAAALVPSMGNAAAIPSPGLKAVLECRQENPMKIVAALKRLKGVSLNAPTDQSLAAPLMVLGEPITKLMVSVDPQAGEGMWAYTLKKDFDSVAKQFKLGSEVITLPSGMKQASTYFVSTSLTIEQVKGGTRVSCGYGAM